MKSILLIEWTEEKNTTNTSRTTWLFEGLCQLRLWHFQGHYRYVSSSSYSSHRPHRKIFCRNRTSEPVLSPRLVSRSIELCSFKGSGFEMTGYGWPSNLKRCFTSISFILKFNLYAEFYRIRNWWKLKLCTGYVSSTYRNQRSKAGTSVAWVWLFLDVLYNNVGYTNSNRKTTKTSKQRKWRWAHCCSV